MFLKNMTQNSQYEDERTPSTITVQKTMRTREGPQGKEQVRGRENFYTYWDDTG